MSAKHDQFTPNLPAVFKGTNELPAFLWTLVVGGHLLYFVFDGAIGIAGILMAINIFLALGIRYRCEVDSTGIFLVRYVAYFWPIKRQRFFLDAYPDLYESWGSDKPEGVFISTTGSFEPESEVFGPLSVRAQQRLCDAIAAAVDHARSLCPPAPSHLRFPPLNHHANSLQILSWRFDGPPKTVKALESIPLFGMQIPKDSTFHFGFDWGQHWRDPRRDDALAFVECAESTLLPWGQRILEGAWLYFGRDDDGISLENGFSATVHLDGRWVNGRETIRFSPDGNMTQYTLAEPVTIGRLGILPPGSTVRHTRNRRGISVNFATATQIKDHVYAKNKTVLLRAPWHLSRYTFGLWQPKFILEDFGLNLGYNQAAKSLTDA